MDGLQEFGLSASRGLALRAQPAPFWGCFRRVAIDDIGCVHVATLKSGLFCVECTI
jgi:hypothetical protein